MRQYEFAIRIAQIHHLVEERKFKKALAVIRTLDMRQVKNVSDLTIIADVFAKTEQFDSAKEAYLKIYNKSKTRRVVYRLISIAIRTKELGEAEKYYHEFMQMNPSTRDVIILRYRIDKAAGVHIGKLVETLEELKEEEYIEEWAYELARLYYKAGRFEECRRECEDILLWFGHGEIVERAKKLIEYVDDREAMPYLDDKDYTVDRNEPNPDDTGSLPDLHEYLAGMQREEDNRKKHLKERKIKEQPGQDAQYKKEAETAVTKEDGGGQQGDASPGNSSKDSQGQDDFIDDYEEDDFEIDAGFGKLAQKLTGFLHFGRKKDADDTDINSGEDTVNSYGNKGQFTENSKGDFGEESYIIEDSGKENLDIKIKINKDLYNKTIAEAGNLEKENTKKEYPVKEDLNITNAGTGNMDNTEVEFSEGENKNTNEESTDTSIETGKGSVIPPEPVYFQSGMGITQDLSREISAIYEAEHREQLKEKSVKVIDSRRPLKRDATKVIERMTKAVKSDENKNLPSASAEEPALKAGHPEEQAVEKTEEKVLETGENIEEEPQKKVSGQEERIIYEEKNTKTANGVIRPVIPELEDSSIVVSKEEIDLAEMEAKRAHEEALVKAEEAKAIVEEARRKAEEAARMLAEIEKKHAGAAIFPDSNREREEENSRQKEQVPDEAITEEASRENTTEEFIADKTVEDESIAEKTVTEESLINGTVEDGGIEEKTVTEESLINGTVEDEGIEEKTVTEESLINGTVEDEGIEEKTVTEESLIDGTVEDEGIAEKMLTEEIVEEETITEEPSGQQTEYEEESLSDDDLPTTRALHTSFDDILTLIGGEPDPSHFVFVGNTFDLITGLSKRIVRVMKNTGYMSIGRIARISAKNLNKMNLAEFKNQLKGNCLLIDEAADLMIPTIASIFEIMDEYYGDFVVILADNGNTLDQLFKFAPALARRFKYIIDISGYTEEDCQ